MLFQLFTIEYEETEEARIDILNIRFIKDNEYHDRSFLKIGMDTIDYTILLDILWINIFK